MGDPRGHTLDEKYEKMRNSKELTKELEGTFPASDPPAVTQPGGGITGPEDVKPVKPH